MRGRPLTAMLVSLTFFAALMATALWSVQAQPSAGSFVNTTGGPDSFGYTFADSDEPGCTTSFQDVSGSGAPLAGSLSYGVTLPFTFTLYGVDSTSLVVNDFGAILFDRSSGLINPANSALPNGSYPLAILPFWDLLIDSGGEIYTDTVGTAPDRQFIVQWHDRPHQSSSGTVRFQAVLYEGSNRIDFVYDDVVFGSAALDSGASATVGLNQDGSNALQYSYNTAALSDGLAICFFPPVPAPRLAAGSYKAATTDVVGVGQPLTYTIVLSNGGDAAAASATLSDPVPANATYVAGSLSASAGTPAFGNNTVSWSGAIGAGDVVTVTYAAVPSLAACGASLVNVATVTDPGLDGDLLLAASTGVANRFHNFWQFESSEDGFVGSGDWAWGDLVPAASAGAPPAAYQGRLWGTNLAGDITIEPSDHYLTRTVTLPQDPEGLLLSWHDWWDEDTTPDVGQVSVDGTTLYTVDADQHAWVQHTVDVSAWAGQTVDLVFYYQATGGGTGGAGWYVDGVRVYGSCAPVMDILPAAVTATQPVPAPITRSMTISNPGTLSLSWTLIESADDGCAVGDIPWLSVDPQSGGTAAGSATGVAVVLDAAGLAPDVYTAALCATGNAPAAPLVVIPVTLTVPSNPAITVDKTVGAGSGACATTSEIDVTRGTEVSYCYTVTNSGNVTLTHHTVVDDKLGSLLTDVPLGLVPGASTSVMFTSTIEITTTNTVTWTAFVSGTAVTAMGVDSATVNVVPFVYYFPAVWVRP